jgi:ribonuclease HI
MTIHAFTDGASRGNPGESGIGVILKDEHGNTLHEVYGYIGRATNNVAEYTALIQCLERARTMNCTKLVVHSDSELMVRQLNGTYKVKEPTLKRYYQRAQELLRTAPFTFSVVHVARDKNREADALANKAIERRIRLNKRRVAANEDAI